MTAGSWARGPSAWSQARAERSRATKALVSTTRPTRSLVAGRRRRRARGRRRTTRPALPQPATHLYLPEVAGRRLQCGRRDGYASHGVDGVRLAGKHAVVTGSTRGIGLGIARAFVREGARVVIHSRSAADCARVAKELGGDCVPIAADLARSDEVRRLALEALAAFGDRVDILVNNAGQPRVAPSEELSEADYR